MIVPSISCEPRIRAAITNLANVPDQSCSQLASNDFFTLHTISFEVLFVFVVLAHDRRRVLHFNVTVHPTAEWTAQQIVEAFPFDSAPKYLLRDRDRIYGYEFRKQPRSHGHPRNPQRTTISLATGLRRTLNRIDPAGMLGPRHCLQWRMPA